MILRHRHQGRPQRPVTVRERWYVATAHRLGRTTRRMRRFIGSTSRLYEIIRALGLPALPKGPRA